MELSERQYYLGYWVAVLKNIVAATDEQIEKWIKRIGEALLADEDMVSHELPWYWICPTVCHHFSRQREATSEEIRVLENKIFWELDQSFRGTKLENVDWMTLTERIKGHFPR